MLTTPLNEKGSAWLTPHGLVSVQPESASARPGPELGASFDRFSTSAGPRAIVGSLAGACSGV
jgi:hypothetical protein